MKHSDKTSPTTMPSIVGGRVTGIKHTKAGEGCDDAFAWISFSNGAQVLAVADGAGSVTGTSAWGSWAATQFVTLEPVARSLVEQLAAATNKDRASYILRLAFRSALNYVLFFGKLMDISPELMNTTLCVAVLIPGHAYVAEIGDGIVAIMGDDKAETVLMENKGESAATDTYFLQLLGKDGNHPQWRFDDFGPIPAIALSTDGLRYKVTSFKDGYAAYPNIFEKLWEYLEAGKLPRYALEKWLRTNASQDDPPGDDKTLLLAIREDAASMSGKTGAGILSDCSPRPGGPEPVVPTTEDPEPVVPTTEDPEPVVPTTEDPEPVVPTIINSLITYDSPQNHQMRSEGGCETFFKKILHFFLRKVFNFFRGSRNCVFNNCSPGYAEQFWNTSGRPTYSRVEDEVSKNQPVATKQAPAPDSYFPPEEVRFRNTHGTHEVKGSESSVSQQQSLRSTSEDQPISAIEGRRPRRPRQPRPHRRSTSNDGNSDF